MAFPEGTMIPSDRNFMPLEKLLINFNIKMFKRIVSIFLCFGSWEAMTIQMFKRKLTTILSANVKGYSHLMCH